jgi:Ca2+-binding EF-hand superfamily protein
MDENNDGLISISEFSKMMAAEGSSKAEIEAAFAAIDQDNAGVIKFVSSAHLANPPSSRATIIRMWG